MRHGSLTLVLVTACASSPVVSAVVAPSTRARSPVPARDAAPAEASGDDTSAPEFARLPPRDREQWHACHSFFLTRARPDRRDRGEMTLEFSLSLRDYLAQSDARARRKLLIDNGCPDTLVDLADGTHLDLIEGRDE